MVLVLAWFGVSPAFAAPGNLQILVASKKTPAGQYAAAQAKGNLRYAPRLFRALDMAAEHLSSCGQCTVTIKIAGQTERGKGRVGQWVVPEMQAPQGRLIIAGGYDQKFETRRPFEHPTMLQVSERRTGPVLSFAGRRTEIGEVIISGLIMDVAPGNRYDRRSGALTRSASSTRPILGFGNLKTQRLLIADNVFANGAGGVAAPTIQAASPTASVIVQNNLFLSNVLCWRVVAGSGRHSVDKYIVQFNSFVGNHPYNPDRNTSNPGTLEIGNKRTAQLISIRRNVFMDNAGGAIFPQWDDTRGPKMEIVENLFFRNGSVFQVDDPAAAAVVGKFNGSGVHGTYTADEVEEEFSWTAARNMTFDPKIAFTDVPLEAGDDRGPKRTAGRAGSKAAPSGRAFGRRMVVKPGRLPFAATEAGQKLGASPQRILTF